MNLIKKSFIVAGIITATLQVTNSFADQPMSGKLKYKFAGYEKKAFKFNEGVTEKDYMPNTVVVKIDSKYKSSLQRSSIGVDAINNLMQKIGAESSNQMFPNSKPSTQRGQSVDVVRDLSGIYKIKYTANIPIEDVINEFLKLEEVVYAEPSYIYRTSYIPNDPDTLSGKNYYQKIIKAYEAWNVNKGDTSVVIGIIDTGGDLDHPDLAANVKYNYADPIDGLDNDNDGYVDNFKGWDFMGASSSNVVPDGDPSVKSGGNDHGVHVGGDASAVADNGVGIAGVGFKSKLLFVKCTPDPYDNGIYTGYEGIVYAADHGAQVINCSWGGSGGGQLGQDAIDYAISKGSLVVAAAGNNGSQINHYPSAFRGVLAVASSTSSDRKSNFSNFGYWVDIIAPGSSIYSTTFNDGYNSYDGTSMASPIVAGAAALVKAQFPNFTPMQVGEQLRVTADDINSLNNAFRDKIGKGRLNVYKALTVSSPSIRAKQISLMDNNNGSFLPNDTITMTLDLINYLANTSNLQVTISSTSSAITIVNASQNAGAINTLQSKLVSNFKIFIKPTATENQVVPVKITYTDGTYVDNEYIEIELNITAININVNQIASTATGNGRIGYRNGDATGGLGVVYNGQSMLYEASFMVAASNTQVSNNARSETATPDNHFTSTERIKRVFANGVDFFSAGEFNDAASTNPMNITVKHRELAWATAPNDKYFIAEYRIKNNNASALNNIFAGMFFDWDIVNSAANKIVYDTLLRMAYCSTFNTGEPMAAVKILNTNVNPSYYGQSYNVPGDPQEGGYSIAEKYLTLSSGIVNTSYGTTAPGLDAMFSIGAGPYNLNTGETALLSLAIIAGDDLADLTASAVAAQAKYDQFVTSLGIENNQVKLSAIVYPNPAKDLFSIATPKELTNAKVSIVNILGSVLYTKEFTGLNDTFLINDCKLPSGVYMVTVDSKEGKVVEKLVIE